MDQATAATKIIEMEGDKFTAGDRQIKRKLLRDRNRSSTDALPFSNDGAKSRRQTFEMVGLPTVLRHSAERECRLEHPQQAEKRHRHRTNSSHCDHRAYRNRKSF